MFGFINFACLKDRGNVQILLTWLVAKLSNIIRDNPASFNRDGAVIDAPNRFHALTHCDLPPVSTPSALVTCRG
jgi:hypothetical protein